MQLTCPNCGARYRIDASDWPTDPGPEGDPVFRPRRARCKVCRTVWAAVPEEEVLELDDPLPPDEEHPRLGDAAWSSVGGWPDPRPLPPPEIPAPDFTPPLDRPPPVFTPEGFRPPKDPQSEIFAAPSRPAIHFEAPPVPVAVPERPPVRTRLPGPGALQPEPDPVAIAPLPAPADEPEPAEPDIDEAYDDGWEEPRPRRWPWVVGGLAALAAVAGVLVGTGRVDPADYGLPAFAPGKVAMPALPEMQLPRKAPPPLTLSAEVARRDLPGGRQVWEIAGLIGNPTADPQAVPPVEIQLIDARGEVVGRWTVRPETQGIAPRQQVRFETSAIDPPSSAVSLKMVLKPAELGRL